MARVGIHGGVGINDVVLEALGVTLGMAGRQYRQASLLGRPAGWIAYQDLGAGLATDPQQFWPFLIKYRALMHPIHFNPQPILATGAELADHCRASDIVRGTEQDQG